MKKDIIKSFLTLAIGGSLFFIMANGDDVFPLIVNLIYNIISWCVSLELVVVIWTGRSAIRKTDISNIYKVIAGIIEVALVLVVLLM
ncbi:MAG: hypothetical protein MJZ82_01905 [Paludibacteraceae bacterium]|nr:hypothetical protein [Paludibacteraceae bacterium]